MKAALQRCDLDHLVERLDEQERWDRVLSGGEQQRLAFARLLLHKPDWVFMDEATSALDEESQASMMGLFTKELAGTTVVRSRIVRGIDAFHDRTLTLVETVGGARLVTKRAARLMRKQHRRKRRPLTISLRRFKTPRREHA